LSLFGDLLSGRTCDVQLCGGNIIPLNRNVIVLDVVFVNMEDDEIIETSSNENNNITDSEEQIVLTHVQDELRERAIDELRTGLRRIDGDRDVWNQVIEHVVEDDVEHDTASSISSPSSPSSISSPSSPSSPSSTISHSSDETDSESSYLNELSTEHVESLISTSIQDIEKYFESLKKQIKVLKKKCSIQKKSILSLEKEKTKCRLCNRNDINIVYFPCLHLGCCTECDAQIRDERCPFCRTNIKGVVQCYPV
jgi:hypothetical protein